MATVIRMKRGGRTHSPYYRVVVMDSRVRATGRVIDELGVYHPCGRPQPVVEIDVRKALDWLRKGATPSDTVKNVLSQKGVMAVYASGGSYDPETPVVMEAPAAAEAPVAEAAVSE